MNGWPLRDNNIAGVPDDGNAIRVEKLSILTAALAELELEASLLVEDLQKSQRVQN